jgi:pimeloyl-ACP methyl ester carboxylesterase
MQYWKNWASLTALLLAAPALMAQAKPRDRYAEVNGVKLHYVEQGAKGPVILFLHGFPEFWYAWKDMLAEFSKDYRAVAPDMRGYNLSARPEGVEQYRLPLLVEDVRALADKLGAKKFTLVGHDWGGVVAWAFAAEHPEMLDYLIIINAPHPTVFARELAKNPDQQKASAYFNLFTSDKAEAALSQNDFERFQGEIKGWASDQDRREYLANWKRGLTGGLNYYRAAGLRSPVDGQAPTAPTLAPLKPITVPTMVVWGEKDSALLTGNLDGLNEYVKDLTVKRIKDGSHWVVHEKPGLMIGYIRDFIRP